MRAMLLSSMGGPAESEGIRHCAREGYGRHGQQAADAIIRGFSLVKPILELL